MPASLGKWYDQSIQGNVYIGSTAAAGTAMPLATGTAMTFGLWNINPLKVAVLLRFTGTYTSGTIALGGFGLSDLTTPSYSIATGGPITAFTDGILGTTIRNARIGDGGPTMKFTPSAATITASTAYYWLGSGSEGSTETSTLAGRSTIDHDFNGSVIVMPGHAAFAVGSVAQTGLYSMSLVWAEVPL